MERRMTTQIDIIDADSHIIEPADLWTSRVPVALQHLVPQVDVKPGSTSGTPRWRISGDVVVTGRGTQLRRLALLSARPSFDPDGRRSGRLGSNHQARANG